MHRQFALLLPDADGDSELVVALNVDVRGFSTFSERVESVEAALYLRTIYLKMMETYFREADFIKSTGDGLMVIFRVTKNGLEDELAHAVRVALKLTEEFSGLAADDPLINFPVPTKVGIGVARGAACRLSAGDKTLDYSGRVLNLATRLMDLARPEGVVIDGAYGLELLPGDLQELFEADRVYLRSIAESEARQIHYTAEYTEIPDAARKPLDEISWKREVLKFKTLGELIQKGPRWRHRPAARPLDERRISVEVTFPAVGTGGKRQEGVSSNWFLTATDFTYIERAGEYFLRLNLDRIGARLVKHGVRRTWGPLRITVGYPAAP